MAEEVSKVELYLQSKGFKYRQAGDQQFIVDSCPIPDEHGDVCGASNKFYINRQTFLWLCQKCREGGNEWTLKQKLGDKIQGISSQRDSVQQKTDPLPDIEVAHQRLMSTDAVLNYLTDERGWSLNIIKQQKIGLEEHDFYQDGENLGKFNCLIYPYINGGNLVFAKWRTVPPAKKMFRSTKGRGYPLYNQDAFDAHEEIVMVEGEADAISCLDNGVPNVVGVPGADCKKATWDYLLNRPIKKYLLYDNDKAGQEGAYNFACRFGIENFYNILIPEFQTADGKVGTDIGEWFAAGHTLEEFELLKKSAQQFVVRGCTSMGEALDEIIYEVEERGVVTPEFEFPWPSLNAKIGGGNRGEVIAFQAPGKIGKSTVALNAADYWVEQGKTGLFFCLEMPAKKLATKWVSFRQLVDMSPYKGVDAEGKMKYDRAKAEELKAATIRCKEQVIPNRTGDLLFGHTRFAKEDDVFETIKLAKRRYGIDFLVFDNLQLFVDTINTNPNHRATKLSMVGKKLKRLAEELNILILLIVQPKKLRDGEICTAQDSDGSGAIEKDVDAMVIFSRNKIGNFKKSDIEHMGNITTDENFEPKMYCRTDLSRYAPGGICWLWFEGKYSLAREIMPDDGVSATPNLMGEGIPVGEMAAEAV
jgi:KaiC/GvpD/RAD55 family RecA-like ATPase